MGSYKTDRQAGVCSEHAVVVWDAMRESDPSRELGVWRSLFPEEYGEA